MRRNFSEPDLLAVVAGSKFSTKAGWICPKNAAAGWTTLRAAATTSARIKMKLIRRPTGRTPWSKNEDDNDEPKSQDST